MTQFDHSYIFLILPRRLCTGWKNYTSFESQMNKLSTKCHIYLKKVNLLILVSKYSTDLHKLSMKTKLNWVRDMISLNKKEMTLKQNFFKRVCQNRIINTHKTMENI